MSVIIWYFSEAFGMILTGMATDFNSGLLLVVMALAVWPRVSAIREARTHLAREGREERHVEGTSSTQHA
jgi:hypothetical protein